MMPLHIVTIALDAMPFLPMRLNTFNRLSDDVRWTWHIVEGVADNIKDTGWCSRIAPRLSRDGTTEFLASLRGHPRVRVYQQQLWPGKTAMFNHALLNIRESCCLLECDADELWDSAQLWLVANMFERYPEYNCARFLMKYFVGLNIVTVGDNCYGNNPGEWLRAWKFEPGMAFKSHEPPFLEGVNGSNERCATREWTSGNLGLVPHHWAYVFPHQLKFKEEYYKYPNALAQWQRLQTHPGPWPVKLRDFLPWVDDRAMANLIHT